MTGRRPDTGGAGGYPEGRAPRREGTGLCWRRTAVQVICFLGILLALHGCVSAVIYQPQEVVPYTPADAKLPYEDVRFTAEDGVKLAGWWIAAPSARGTVLYCHGNGGNIASYLDAALVGTKLGLNMFLFDYRGYGTSAGTPSEAGTYRDAAAAWNYLVGERKIPPERIVIWGRSLGGAIAARTAADRPAGAVILESAFTSLPALARHHADWVPSVFFAAHRYDTRRYLDQVTAPVLVIHSPDDEIVPFQHGRSLYEAIRGPKAFLEIHGSHNRGTADSAAVYEAAIKEFVDRYLGKEEEKKEGGLHAPLP